MGASFNHPGQRSRRKRAAFTEINVTPFVDVMLVLLIIFMVTAPMLTAGVNVDLPDSKASALPGQDEPLTVTVTKEGKVFIQETETSVDDLQAKLRAITGEKTDTRIFVRGDRNVDYGRMMLVVGEINAANFTKVSLLTDVNAAPPKKKR